MMDRAEHLRTMARLALRGYRARGEAEGPLHAPRRKVAVERERLAPPEARVRGYLRATDGERIAGFGGDEAVLPPILCATWETALTLELLCSLDAPLPLGGVLHLENELVPLRPLRPADRVRCRVELERSETTPRGVRLTICTRNWNGSGQLCTEGTSVFLVRSRDPSPAKSRADEEPADTGGWDEVARWKLGPGAGRRYALASGDFNPIHLWGFTARPFGFRRPILHGFCTEALVAHALVERLLGGDPTALRRLHVAFRAPLLLPAEARLLVRERAFRVVAGEGPRVCAEGEFVGRVKG